MGYRIPIHSKKYLLIMPSSLNQIKSELMSLATEVFDNQSEASSWFVSNNRVLGMSPLEWIQLKRDPNEIRKILNVINYGGVV
jgi:hypothetical protein